MPSLLIAEDPPGGGSALAGLLRIAFPDDLVIRSVQDAGSCLAALRGGAVDCLLLDYWLPGRDGLSLLPEIRAQAPGVPVIMMTRAGHEAVAAEALKRGAQDYLLRQAVTPSVLARSISGAMDRAVQARRQARESEELRCFAGTLVHDLRAPLRSVTCGAALLAEALPREIATARAAELGYITEGAAQMDRLITALADYCLLEGEADFEEAVDLGDVVARLRALMGADLAARGAQLTADPDLPVVRGNLAQLLQLLQNLVANGVKFNRSEGPHVHISATGTAEGWLIAVEDNGIGIAPEHAARIFEPFRRLHAQDAFPGSGLGLATCRRIAEGHGGRLTCRSTPGQGACFLLDLPRHPVRAEPPRGVPRGAGRFRPSADSRVAPGAMPAVRQAP